MAAAMNEVINKYKTFVKNNPDTCGQIESIIRIGSYLAPGNSSVFSELLHASSNLLALLNDAILRKAANVKIVVPVSHHTLASWLTVLDYIEVFLEIAGDRYGGETGKWTIVVCVHIAKAVIRYFMLLKYKSGVQYSPPIPPLRRNKLLSEKLKNPYKGDTDQEIIYTEAGETRSDHGPASSGINGTVTLKRSGKIIRKLSAAPPLTRRTWKLPDEGSESPKKEKRKFNAYHATPLDLGQTMGESLHIARPLAHLCSMYLFGQASWKPFLVALGMDVSSSCLMGDPKDFNPAEEKELKRRTMIMLLYLLRSPFYDRHFKARLILSLNFLAANIPGVRIIIRPLLDYLPTWQKLYFYVWQM